MKLFILALSALSFSLSAQAETPVDPCEAFMPCGTYEGEGISYDAKGGVKMEFSERWVISRVDALTLNIVQSMSTKGENPEEFFSVDVNAEFTPDGRFVIRDFDDSIYAAGICQHQVCGFAFTPFTPSQDDQGAKGVVANVNTFRFEGSKFKRLLMVTSNIDEKPRLQKAELTKK